MVAEVETAERFCHPVCKQCSHAVAMHEAERMARSLAERLGQDWKGQVWCNLGWHYRAAMINFDPNIEVTVRRELTKSYDHYLCEVRVNFGDGSIKQFLGAENGPRQAYERAVEKARNYAFTLSRLLDKVERKS